MKKIIVVLMLSFVLLFGFGSFLTQARAETMNFKLVSMTENAERVKVNEIEGAVLGVMDRKGLSIFENGDIAPTNCKGTFDLKRGFQGYSSLSFADGSTVVLWWKGPTSRIPSGGNYWGYSASFEYVKGTGRFEGIKGNGSFKSRGPNWDKEYKAKGFMVYDFTGTYTLPQ
jgi:hypothetical protein